MYSQHIYQRNKKNNKKKTLSGKALNIKVIQETIEENHRKGNFKRIYPNDKVFYYKPFFEQDRHFNMILR